MKRAKHHADHVRLVIFVRSEDVEIFDARDFVEIAVAQRVQVEKMFRVAVHVQRFERKNVRFVIHSVFAVPVSCGGGRVHEARAVPERERGEFFRVFVIVVNEVGAVFFRRRGACAEVKHGFYIGETRGIGFECAVKILVFHVFGEFERNKVFETQIRAEFVGRENVRVPELVETRDDGAADESGAAGDENFSLRNVVHNARKTNVKRAALKEDFRRAKKNPPGVAFPTDFFQSPDFSRSQASRVCSAEPNPVRRKYPSPLGPKPEPGVPTMCKSFNRWSKNCHEVIPAGVFTQT